MMPWERDIYVILLEKHIKDEEERKASQARNANANIIP